MKTAIALFLALCVFGQIIGFCGNFEIVIPQKYVVPLYDYYTENFTPEDAYYRLCELRRDGEIMINGVLISTTKKRNAIYISHRLLYWLPIYIWGKNISIGCGVPMDYYLSYLAQRIDELIKTGSTEFYRHNKSEPLKVRINGRAK